MDDKEISATVLKVVRSIAPEIEPDRIETDKPLRSPIDPDSMDWLNVDVELRDQWPVHIPAFDCGRPQTLNAIVACLGARQAPRSPG